MAFGVWVPLSYDDKKRLLELARKERRDPRQQAAVILERVIAEQEEHAREPEPVVV